ncbi:hypothetical protein [Streptomyces sp. NPDC059788]|uniref:hypothetical protein n=1 Tax=Streptomyces sp. NPDC059788 TaxID=3346948 RepID=UPI00364E41EE
MKEHDEEALFPMPARSEQALRAAVERLDPTEAVRFERDFHAAWETALLEDSTVPMQTFLYRWGVFVALHRIPSRSARLRELERAVGSAASLEEARTAGKEIEELLEVAAREAASA